MTFLALCFFLYFAPALVASSRRHESAPAVWILNFLLGWTVVGWVICLIWALSLPQPLAFYPVVYALPSGALGQPPGWTTNGGVQTPVCTACYRPVTATASYCGMCGAVTRHSA